MQRMICIPSNQYSQMLESYDNAMKELQELKERPEELLHILDRLRPDIKIWRKSGNRNGQFKKAYIEIKERPA